MSSKVNEQKLFHPCDYTLVLFVGFMPFVVQLRPSAFKIYKSRINSGEKHHNFYTLCRFSYWLVLDIWIYFGRGRECHAITRDAKVTVLWFNNSIKKKSVAAIRKFTKQLYLLSPQSKRRITRRVPTSPPLTAYMTWVNWGRHGTAIYVHRLQTLYCKDGGLHGNPYDIPLLVFYPWSIVRLRGDDSIITVTLKTLSTGFHIACGFSACNTIITHHLIVRGFISRNSVAGQKALHRLSSTREVVETKKDSSVRLGARVQAERPNGKISAHVGV
jgi:hypothetical protein